MTINDLVFIFREFANKHKGIHSFYFMNQTRWLADTASVVEYPALFLEQPSIAYTDSTGELQKRYIGTFGVFAGVNDGNDNEDYAVGEAESIVDDLILELLNNPNLIIEARNFTSEILKGIAHDYAYAVRVSFSFMVGMNECRLEDKWKEDLLTTNPALFTFENINTSNGFEVTLSQVDEDYELKYKVEIADKDVKVTNGTFKYNKKTAEMLFAKVTATCEVNGIVYSSVAYIRNKPYTGNSF
jgi:hypothetical protein